MSEAFRYFDNKPSWLVPALPTHSFTGDPQFDWEFMTPKPYKLDKAAIIPSEFVDARCYQCGAGNGDYHHAECEIHFMGYETASGWLYYSRAQVHYNVRHAYLMAVDRNIRAAVEFYRESWKVMVAEGVLRDPARAKEMFRRMKVKEDVESYLRGGKGKS